MTNVELGNGAEAPGSPQLDPALLASLSESHAEPQHAESSSKNATKEKPAVTIHDLCIVGAADPETPRLSKAVTPDVLEEIRYLYINEYAVGLDQFLDSSWYSTKGVEELVKNTSACEMFAGIIDLFANTKSENYDAMRFLPSAESRLVWTLMRLPRLVHSDSEPSLDLVELLDHIMIFEKLIIAQCIDERELPSIMNQSSATDHGEIAHRDAFWKYLARFVSLPSASITELDELLKRMADVLDQVENRDVLYSIAVIRHLGLALPDFPRTISASSLDPVSRDRLSIAKNFIEDEAMGKGTTQVVQRLCGMAMRSWATLT